jgi:hypothetical protein
MHRVAASAYFGAGYRVVTFGSDAHGMFHGFGPWLLEWPDYTIGPTDEEAAGKSAGKTGIDGMSKA